MSKMHYFANGSYTSKKTMCGLFRVWHVTDDVRLVTCKVCLKRMEEWNAGKHTEMQFIQRVEVE